MGNFRIECDKLGAKYTISIPTSLWEKLKGLDERGKKALNRRLMHEIARVVHERIMFDPALYLSSDPRAVQRFLGKLSPTNITKSKLCDLEEYDE